LVIKKAREFAINAHEGQFYGPSDKPYSYHLEKVVLVLKRFGIETPEILAAGWLHDALEDTDVTLEDITENFGIEVARLVDAVTDGEGATRSERKARPYRLIPTCPGAVCLKLADRIANLEASISEGHDRLLRRYASEHPAFMSALYNGSCPAMWMYLDHLFLSHGYVFTTPDAVGLSDQAPQPQQGEPNE